MRILHVIPGIALTSGGPRNLIGLVECLTRHGVDTTLLTTNLGATTTSNALTGSGDTRGATHDVHNIWAVGGRYGLAPSMARTRTARSAPTIWFTSIGSTTSRASQRHGRRSHPVCPTSFSRTAASIHTSRKKNQLVKQVYMATVGWPLLRKAAAVVFDTPEEGQLASARAAASRMDVADGARPRGFRSPAVTRHIPHRVPRGDRAVPVVRRTTESAEGTRPSAGRLRASHTRSP